MSVSAGRMPPPLPRRARQRTTTPSIGEASATPGYTLFMKIFAAPSWITPVRSGSGLGPMVTAAWAGLS